MISPKLPQWMQDHIKLYQEDPEKGRLWDSGRLGGPGVLQTLLLTTTGRKSGEPRLLPLIYEEVDGSFVIVASKGGAPADPSWFVNLQANPKAHIQVGSDHHDVVARIAEGEERAKLWDVMSASYAPYNDYQAATERLIPVVVLDPK
jgi:deazaflavin-dependent oxidoreductase (nitroreductase family)